MPLELVVLLPLIAAGIGWLTNRLAIRFIFRPKEPVGLLGFKFQGLLPRRKKDLADKVSQTVAQSILPAELIGEQIRKLDLNSYTKGLADRLVNEVLVNRLQKVPLVSALLGPSTLEQLKAWVEKELEREAGVLLEKVGQDAAERIDFAGLMRERIEAFDNSVLEAIVRKVANKEFRAIEWWGFFIGLVVGFIQVGLVLVL
ncbi:MAG: DUF445 domain-containing protein [Puniceicoccaceae bacterium]